jgi:integrase
VVVLVEQDRENFVGFLVDLVGVADELVEGVRTGNLLSALRGMIRWMIDAGHLKEEDDPTIGLRSGKSRASRESGGWVPWTDEDMAKFRERWPLGTMARLMFDILHYTFLRVGDAAQFGPKHLQPMVRQTVVQIATEKSQGRTIVTVPVHPDFAASLRAARAAGILGDETFTGKIVKDKTLPIGKKSSAKKFKTYVILAGVNQPKKNCHGVRKARAEIAAYAECTEAQMMAMFGWTDPKMPAHYIAKARREKLGMTGMERIVAYDKSAGLDLLSLTNGLGTGAQNKVVTIPPNRSNLLKKAE